MKVFIVNTSDIIGGASRAAYRLHSALLVNGIDSTMVVQSKFSDDHTVLAPSTKIQKTMAVIRPTLDNLPLLLYKNRKKMLFSPNWLPFSPVATQINAIKPDIVHLHWLGGGMMRIEDIAKINAPIVWSLHDMWPFTGGCHYADACDAFNERCGRCPILGSQKTRDISTTIFLKKQRLFGQLKNMVIIGLSSWLASLAKNSTLLKNTPIYHLPNLIDTTVFSPFDQNLAKHLFNLPIDKKLILFGAVSATSDPRKGFAELSAALQKIDIQDYELVIFGSGKPKTSQNFKQKVHYLGRLHDDISLRLLYNAADVMVVPSLQENLSNVIMEAMACGTPVVSFNIGGNADLIEHQQNGYLAKPFDCEELAHGISWVLNSPNYSELCENSRAKILYHFSSEQLVKKYIALYNHLLEIKKTQT